MEKVKKLGGHHNSVPPHFIFGEGIQFNNSKKSPDPIQMVIFYVGYCIKISEFVIT